MSLFPFSRVRLPTTRMSQNTPVSHRRTTKLKAIRPKFEGLFGELGAPQEGETRLGASLTAG